MPIHPIRPDLTEERLVAMQAEASQVWRGEKTPKQSMAANILYLIAEVRKLRKKLEEQPNDKYLHRGFDDVFKDHTNRPVSPESNTMVNSLFESFDNLFSGLRKTVGRKKP